VHPDRAESGSADEMAAVNEAYRVLNEPGRRALYDRSLDGTTPAGSAVPRSARPDDVDVFTTLRRPTYNYAASHPADVTPARVPWRFLGVLTAIGVGSVLLGAALVDGPAERQPDGVIRSGSCVEIMPNTDAREVRCEGAGDLVVEQLIPTGGRCPAGTTPHRDQLGLGVACVLPPIPIATTAPIGT
jgi:molecular chaperone DnaJ